MYSPSNLQYSNCTIEANNLYDNVTADLYVQPGVFELPTNRIKNNTGWMDVQSNNTASATSSTTTTTLKSLTIPANSLGTTRGIKIKAWGFVSGTNSTKVVSVKFGTAARDDINFAAADAGNFLFEIEIFSRGSTTTQNKIAKMVKGTAISNLTNQNLTVDNGVDQLISVTASVANASDSVTCNGLIVERI